VTWVVADRPISGTGVGQQLSVAVLAMIARDLKADSDHHCCAPRRAGNPWHEVEHSWPASQANSTLAAGPVQYTVLVNQTAIHGVPTALNAVNQALLRAWTGAPDASIRLVNNPLPMVLGEDALVVNQMSGESHCFPLAH